VRLLQGGTPGTSACNKESGIPLDHLSTAGYVVVACKPWAMQSCLANHAGQGQAKVVMVFSGFAAL